MRGCALLGAAVAAVATVVVGTLSAEASATPPGRNGLIAFYGSTATTAGIFVMNPDGSGVRQVEAASGSEPAWSPDGSQLAFAEVTPNAHTDDDIYTINVDGSGKAQLTDNPDHDFWPTWSPDGTHIAFYSQGRPGADAAIWVMDANGANQRLLSPATYECRNPAWSPDGTKISMACDNFAGPLNLYVISADGTNFQDLTPGPAGAGYASSWSPDGTKIAYTQGGDLYVVNADGSGVPTNITHTGSLSEQDSSWSPDGREIAYDAFSSSSSDIYVSDADGSNPVKITNIPGGFAGGVLYPAWQTLPALATSDSDSDGITDPVDTDPSHASASFDDGAGTSGTITDRAGLAVTVDDAASSTAGVHVAVGAGSGEATLSTCPASAGGPFTVAVAAGSEADITCGSVRVAVKTGQARVLLGGGVTTIAIPAGGDAKVVGASNGTATVQVFSVGAQPVTLNVDGTQSTLAAGTTTPTAAWHFVGFSQPVDNSGVLNIAKAGRVIPFKWRVLDAANQPVTNISNVKLGATTLSCSTGATTDQLEEYASGSSGLQNLGNGYYQFNWSTPAAYANSCKTASLEIGDGVRHTALFSFR